MKIAFIAARYPPEILGGGEISTQMTAEALMQHGLDVTVITSRRSGVYGEECINGVKVVTIPTANIYHFPPANSPGLPAKLAFHLIDRNNKIMQRRVAKILAQNKYDLVHSHTLDGFSTASWLAGVSQTIPVVHTLRSYYLMCANAAMRTRGENCNTQCTSCRLLTRPKCRHSASVAGVVGISQHILDVHLQAGYFPNAEQTVIFNPIAPPPPESIADAKSQTSTIPTSKSTPLRLGYLGRLHETKGIESLIDQVEAIPSTDYVLKIAGYGDTQYVDKLIARTRHLPVEFLGKVTPSDLFAQIDVLIVPSLWNEPFGRVTAESLMHGVPVIGTRNGATKELIQESFNGYLYNADNKNGLTSILATHFIGHPEHVVRLKQNTRDTATRFHPQKIAAEHIAFYNRIIRTQSTCPGEPKTLSLPTDVLNKPVNRPDGNA